MFDWFHLFRLAFLLILIGAVPTDKMPVRIIFIASLASWVIKHYFTADIDCPWKLVVPCCIEALTILALLIWGRTTSGWRQIDLLVIAWLVHFSCLIDLLAGTDSVYSVYRYILRTLTVLQILAFNDTIEHNFGRFKCWLGRLASGRSGVLDHSGGAVAFGHSPRPPGV